MSYVHETTHKIPARFVRAWLDTEYTQLDPIDLSPLHKNVDNIPDNCTLPVKGAIIQISCQLEDCRSHKIISKPFTTTCPKVTQWLLDSAQEFTKQTHPYLLKTCGEEDNNNTDGVF